MNILIIEDSYVASHVFGGALKSYGYHTKHLLSSEVNVQDIDTDIYRLITVGTKLRHFDVKDLIKRLKALDSTVKVLALQSINSDVDPREIIDAGADDLITYPFPIQGVLSRIRALSEQKKNDLPKPIVVKNIVIDILRRKVTKNETTLKLKKKEFTLLEYLARNKNRPVSREELLSNVWDYRRITGSNTVDVHISKLRKKFEDSSLIETVHGIGYQLNDSSDKIYRSVNNDDYIPEEL